MGKGLLYVDGMVGMGVDWYGGLIVGVLWEGCRR